MKRTILALSSALLVAGAGGAFAQTVQTPPSSTAPRTQTMAPASPTARQTAALTSADTQKLGTGWRASKIHGSSVYNDQNEKVGSIDDLIINRDDHVVYAVVSVGGFLGMGNHLVAVPYDQLKINTDNNGKVDKIQLNGATKDSLKSMPEFKYANG
jgi:sporulation protein YlmC with PRC-barrel domain